MARSKPRRRGSYGLRLAESCRWAYNAFQGELCPRLALVHRCWSSAVSEIAESRLQIAQMLSCSFGPTTSQLSPSKWLEAPTDMPDLLPINLANQLLQALVIPDAERKIAELWAQDCKWSFGGFFSTGLFLVAHTLKALVAAASVQRCSCENRRSVRTNNSPTAWNWVQLAVLDLIDDIVGLSKLKSGGISPPTMPMLF